MLALKSPARNHLADYDEFISFRKMKKTKALLTNAKVTITGAYNTYIAAKGQADHLQRCPASDVLQRAWKTNYLLLSSGRPMHKMRDDLLKANRHGRCALCARGNAGTLDHHLPKSAFPEFAAFAPNLVPACDECQRAKGWKWSDDPNRQFVHAYYDHLPNIEILRVRFAVTSTVTIEYYVDSTATCDASLLKKLQYHFRILGLAKHYQQEASLELSDRSEAIRGIFASGNSAEVRAYLASEAKSVQRSRGINNWKSALLSSLADSLSFPDAGIPVLLAQYS